MTDMDPVAFGKAMGTIVREAVAPLLKRIEELESLFIDLDENRFRYRGYWRNGMEAKRGDAYTHDGSLWYANRATDEAPSNESADWAVAARKGRDAR